MTTYRTANTPEDFAVGVRLFKEYAASLPINLAFQDFEHELRTASLQYNTPVGALVLVHSDTDPVGCAGIRSLETGIAELKRMYLRPLYRGQGIGRVLMEHCIATARNLGYQRIRLDTLAHMVQAIGLYRASGFTEIQAYRYNPFASAVYMEKVLE